METRRSRIARALGALGMLAVFSAASRADHYYVDDDGDDANSGTAPGDAWATISHALEVVPDPAPGATHTIHCAPGFYGTMNGESFPLELRPGLQLVGAGVSHSRVDAPTDAPIFVLRSSLSGVPYAFGPDTRVEGFATFGGSSAIVVSTDFEPNTPTFRDLLMHGTSGPCISLSGGGWGGSGNVDPTFTRVRATGGQNALRVAKGGEGGAFDILFEDCGFEDSHEDGVRLVNAGDGGSVHVVFRRCRVESSQGHGVSLRYTNGSAVAATFEDSTIVDNQLDGVHMVVDFGLGGFARLTLERSTVALNVGAGLRLDTDAAAPNANHSAELASSILYGNGDDISESPSDPAITSIRYCCVGDGDHAGTDHNFSADPLFVSPGDRYYAVQYGSPCVDAGDPATPAEALDLRGVARDKDGDLDTLHAPDVGAYELAPLHLLTGPVSVGDVLRLELWGPPDGSAELWFSRGLPVAPPRLLRYGELELDSSSLAWLGTSPTAPGYPVQHALQVPDDPSVIGRSFSIQALTLTGHGAPAMALTNVVSFTVGP